MPTEDISIKDTLSYEEILVKIIDHQVQKFRIKEVASVGRGSNLLRKLLGKQRRI